MSSFKWLSRKKKTGSGIDCQELSLTTLSHSGDDIRRGGQADTLRKTHKLPDFSAGREKRKAEEGYLQRAKFI